MYGYVYLTENLVNHKKYIGRHKSELFDTWYVGSGVRLRKAVEKYGKSNFVTTILCECDSEEELNSKEIEFIDKYNAVTDENFYNISKGGELFTDGLVHMYNEQLDDIIRIDPSNVEQYEKIGYTKGTRPHSQEQIEHYKQGKKDLIPITDDIKTIYIHISELPKYEILGFRRGRDKAARPNQKSENRKWVNKNGKSLMVKQDDLEKYLNDGYSLGRVKFSHFNRIAPPYNKGKKMIEVDGHRKYV